MGRTFRWRLDCNKVKFTTFRSSCTSHPESNPPRQLLFHGLARYPFHLFDLNSYPSIFYTQILNLLFAFSNFPTHKKCPYPKSFFNSVTAFNNNFTLCFTKLEKFFMFAFYSCSQSVCQVSGISQGKGFRVGRS